MKPALNKWLGPNGFVFLDDRPWPFMATDNQMGEWWLYYWSDGRKDWATMRKLDATEVEKFKALALPPEKAQLYAPDWSRFN